MKGDGFFVQLLMAVSFSAWGAGACDIATRGAMASSLIVHTIEITSSVTIFIEKDTNRIRN